MLSFARFAKKEVNEDGCEQNTDKTLDDPDVPLRSILLNIFGDGSRLHDEPLFDTMSEPIVFRHDEVNAFSPWSGKRSHVTAGELDLADLLALFVFQPNENIAVQVVVTIERYRHQHLGFGNGHDCTYGVG
jgi:hypothetical protein